MKVSHRHQVHIQLTGREAGLLGAVLEAFEDSSRLDGLSGDERDVYFAFLNKLSGEETEEDGTVAD